jgi:hypothetical protein
MGAVSVLVATSTFWHARHVIVIGAVVYLVALGAILVYIQVI